MARKLHNLKTSPEAHESVAECNQRPAPAAVAACLAQIRDYAFKNRPPKARQQIAIQVEDPVEMPQVIKIIHTDSI